MTAGPVRRETLRAIVMAVVLAEVGRLRGPGGLVPRDVAASDALTLDEAGLGIDSLEQIGVHAALADMFGTGEHRRSEPDRLPAKVGDWVDAVAELWRTSPPVITVRTSGTTGPAKPCRHDLADLIDEARFFAALIGPRQRVVALVPGHHIYGLIWTILVPELLGAPVVKEALLRHGALAPGDLVIAVPEQWAGLGRGLAPLPADVIGVSAAAPLAGGDAARLLDAGLSRLIEVYGSSETAGIGVREAPAEAYALLPRWRFGPGAPDVTHLLTRAGSPVALPDIIQVDAGQVDAGQVDGGTFTLGRRRDGAVQVAGVNVWPAEVAAVLRGHEDVADAAVRLGRNGRLKAFLVPGVARDADELVGRVAAVAAARLPAPARPVAYSTGPAIPTGVLGKQEDWS